MIVYKCKMCNGNLDMSERKRLVKCNYCDTYQTVPSVIDEDKAEMVNRANHYRQNGEFDRAISIYQEILKEDASDPEIHWSLVLCKFGVEYVEDPATKKMIPTINRTQSHSIIQDSDYQNAISIAEAEAKQYYMSEADKIDQIQKSIWRIAQDSEAYDVFISYKENGPDGKRTESSMIAERLYEKLTAAGIKTFFSRVSLADKIGNEFEPYIFSALNSAYVMLVIGTDRDEFSAPWVKNEWSRYRKAATTDSHKRLIPCVRKATIEDLPDELQPYQAQDMNKDGSEQNILDTVKKIVSKLKASESVLNETNVEKLLKNGETYIALKDFGTAEIIFRDLCEKEPANYRIWWGRIRSVTKDLDDTDALKTHSEDLKIWMDFIKKLAPSNAYSDLVEKYVSYLKKISNQSVYEEIENVKEIREQTCEQAKNLQEELLRQPTEKTSTETDLEKLCAELEDSLETAKNSRESLEEKKELYSRLGYAAMFSLVIPTIIIPIIWICFHDPSYPVFLVVFLLGVSFIAFTVTTLLLKDVESQLEPYDIYVEDLQEQLDSAKNNLEIIRTTKEEKMKNLQEAIQTCNEIVENADRYLTYEPDAISDLLHAIMCSEIGEDIPMDQELFRIKQKTFQPIA